MREVRILSFSGRILAQVVRSKTDPLMGGRIRADRAAWQVEKRTPGESIQEWVDGKAKPVELADMATLVVRVAGRVVRTVFRQFRVLATHSPSADAILDSLAMCGSWMDRPIVSTVGMYPSQQLATLLVRAFPVLPVWQTLASTFANTTATALAEMEMVQDASRRHRKLAKQFRSTASAQTIANRGSLHRAREGWAAEQNQNLAWWLLQGLGHSPAVLLARAQLIARKRFFVLRVTRA